jgi:hypothetical protein
VRRKNIDLSFDSISFDDPVDNDALLLKDKRQGKFDVSSYLRLFAQDRLLPAIRMPSVISPVLYNFVRITDELVTMFLTASIVSILHSGTCVGTMKAGDRQERCDAKGVSDHDI